MFTIVITTVKVFIVARIPSITPGEDIFSSLEYYMILPEEYTECNNGFFQIENLMYSFISRYYACEC